MQLSPPEQQRLLVHVAADIAEKRRSRGLTLNYPETVAILTSQVYEAAAAMAQPGPRGEASEMVVDHEGVSLGRSGEPSGRFALRERVIIDEVAVLDHETVLAPGVLIGPGPTAQIATSPRR